MQKRKKTLKTIFGWFFVKQKQYLLKREFILYSRRITVWRQSALENAIAQGNLIKSTVETGLASLDSLLAACRDFEAHLEAHGYTPGWPDTDFGNTLLSAIAAAPPLLSPQQQKAVLAAPYGVTEVIVTFVIFQSQKIAQLEGISAALKHANNATKTALMFLLSTMWKAVNSTREMGGDEDASLAEIVSTF